MKCAIRKAEQPFDVRLRPKCYSTSSLSEWQALLMADKTFLVRFKPPELSPQTVVAERAEFQGEHLVFLNSMGQFVALFLTDVVESWSEFNPPAPS